MNAIKRVYRYVHDHYFATIVPGEWAANSPLAAEQEVNDFYGTDW